MASSLLNMQSDGKFGTFGGVFTPSILTILGVIMYLRLPWVVGSAGLYQAVGIILVAHLISVSTGLSISSIATDKAVGAGGPYYIISRSLGLPIGGALGLALFVGLSFSISLYVIGFSESLLTYFGLGATTENIRICGTLALVALTTLTFISTALAIKTQYVILALVLLSLVSIVMGAGETASSPHLNPPETDASPLPAVFAIFFPAVTGFTAGVNMSGDLRSPKQSIPRGTMLSIFFGFVVYIGLAVFLAFQVPASQLIEDPELLINVAWSGVLVVAGIWAATLSSALGSILGAPRILQAVSSDAITPKFFARGYGPTREPRNALVLAFLIGEVGVLIGELDVIARVVSMIFLTMYGVLNLSCAVESWASPDFRPEFRIPKLISVIGASTCLVVMIQLDLAAMAGALLLMAGLFLYLSRKQLRLESGDAWEGIWATIVRAGLARLTAGQRQARHWKPNVLAFQGSNEAEPASHRALIEALAGSAGILTHVTLTKRGSVQRTDPLRTSSPTESGEEPPETSAGIFHHQLPYGAEPDQTIVEFCRHYGFAGIEPNAVLLRWSEYETRPEALSRVLCSLSGLDFNQLVLADGGLPERAQKRRIDVWWRDQGGNLPFSLALARFIKTSAGWEGAELRFLLLSGNAGNDDVLRARAQRYLERMRVDAKIEVINNILNIKTQEQWTREKSGDADLVLIPLPDHPSEADTPFLTGLAGILPELPDVLLLRASSVFEEILAPGKSAPESLLPPALEGDEKFRLPEITLPEPVAAQDLMRELIEGYEELLASFDEHCIARVHGQSIDLVRQLKRALDQHFEVLHKGLSGGNVRRRRQAINRFMGSFVIDAQEILDAHLREGVVDQQSTLEGRIDAFLQQDAVLVHMKHTRVTFERDPAAFAKDPNDPGHLRRFKRRRRLGGIVSRRAYRYRVRTAPLTRYVFDRAKREILGPSLTQLVAESHQLAVHLGKLLTSSRANIAAFAAQVDEQEIDLAALADLRARTLESFDELVERTKSRVRRHRRDLLSERGDRMLSELAADLDRLDADRVARKERKLPRGGEAQEAQWRELPQHFAAVQAQLYERAKVGLTLSGFHHRLSAIVQRQQQAVGLSLRNGALRVCTEAKRGIESLLRALNEDDRNAIKPLKLTRNDDSRTEPKEIIDTLSTEIEPALAQLPSAHTLLDDAVIDGLEEGREAALETVELSVRALGQFLVESELLAGIYEELDRAPELESRAIAAARDVTRLVAFQLAELTELGLEDPKERREHVTPGLESALSRLEDEEKALRELATSIDERFDAQLTRVIEGSDPYRLAEASRSLGQHRRLRQGKIAVSGAQGLLRRAYARVREAMVAVLYRGSSSVVVSRNQRAQEQDPGARVERLRALVREVSPEPSTLNAMPFYYRQVFFGQALNESFWVGRTQELARAKQAAQSHRNGEPGVLFVVGAQGSGKTALCQRIVSKTLGQRRSFWVQAPPGGACDVEKFRSALAQAVAASTETSQASTHERLEGLPRHAVVVIDDLELWWERSQSGFAVIDELLELITRHGQDVLFVLSLNRHAFRMLCRLRPLAEQALSVLECGPMPARELGTLLTLRHGSTGMKLELQGKQEEQLSSFQFARLFSRHFSYAGGSVGGALRAWVAHVDKVRDGVLSVRVPEAPHADALQDLPDTWRALLLQLTLHRRLSLSRLTQVTRLPEADLYRDMEALGRAGLVIKSRHGLFEINPFVHACLLSHLEQQELLSA